ncbi:hypothetical protein TNCV_1184621 [Trichonephila clavipes]|nr:hypothetical protein TNCV_1184621 [Trichonephila clavipes]
MWVVAVDGYYSSYFKFEGVLCDVDTYIGARLEGSRTVLHPIAYKDEQLQAIIRVASSSCTCYSLSRLWLRQVKDSFSTLFMAFDNGDKIMASLSCPHCYCVESSIKGRRKFIHGLFYAPEIRVHHLSKLGSARRAFDRKLKPHPGVLALSGLPL